MNDDGPYIIDAENGIWTVLPPVRCQTPGHLVFCNEEIIGSIEQTGPRDFLATYMDHALLRTLGGSETAEQAARAIAVEVLGPMAYENLITDHNAYESACERYILVGPT